MSVLAGVLARESAAVEDELRALETYVRRYGTPSLTRGTNVALLTTGTASFLTIDGRIDDPLVDPYTIDRVIGEFAIAAWDESARTLILARDAFGTRPLYVHANARRIVWASHLAPLLALAGEVHIDDDYLAAFVCRAPMQDRTPVREIRSVAPGTMLVVRNNAIETRRHWQLDPHADASVRGDREAEEKLRALFAQAVRVNLGGDRASVLLSGGVDSSSIVAMADAIRPDPPVQTISWVFETSRTSDETDHIRAVEAHRGLAGIHIGEREQALLDDLASVDCEIPTTYAVFTRRNEATRAAMRAANSRVLLTGIGGDDVLYGDFAFIGSIADAFARGRVLHALGEARRWSAHAQQPFTQILWRSGIRPLLGVPPVSMQASWWTPEFAQRIRESAHTPTSWTTLPSRRFDLQCFASMSRSMACKWWLEHDQITTREPFLYRPLVEYCFALPFDQKLRPGATRSILRRALGDLLPPKVLTRIAKSGPNEALLRATQKHATTLRALFGDSRAVQRGYADRTSIENAIAKISHGFDAGIAFLIRLIALELWLRWFERRPREHATQQGGSTCTNRTIATTTTTKSPRSSSWATPPS